MTALTDGLANVYDRKNLIFMQYGKQWLIHKFDIKIYVEKFVKYKRTCTSFNRFIYNLLFLQVISKRCIKISSPDNF